MTFEIIEEQQKIINSKEPSLLVTARPGRGKTTVALLTANRIIKDREISPTQTILFLTFSKNAVYQIEQASGEILDKQTRNSLWISTYHAFMWWILTTFGRFHNLPNKLDVMQGTKGKAIRSSASLENISKSEMPFYLAKKYSSIEYDDFSPLALSILTNSQVLSKTIQNRFPVIIVDEFQDTNQEQWQLIKTLSENSRLICFADPNQMIFRWRGASGDRLNQFINERHAKECFLQTKCKRTEESALLDFAEAILDNKAGNINEREERRKRFLTSYPGPNALGYSLKTIIRSFYTDFQKRKTNKRSPSIVIAAYSNSTAKAIQDALAKPTEHAKYTYDCDLLESQADDVIEELLLHLAAWASGGEEAQLLQSINLVGGLIVSDASKTNASLAALFTPSKLLSGEIQPKGKAIAKDVLEAFESISRPTENAKDAVAQAVQAIEKLREKKAVSDAIDEEDLHNAQSKILQILNNASNKSALIAINTVRNKLSAERVQMGILERIIPARGIISSTLHKLKGREFDYVCIVTQMGDKLMSKSDDETDARKLMYVALTRARYDARILYFQSNPCFLLNPFLA